MNICLKLRRVVILLSVAAIAITSVPASVFAFSDVPADHWAYEYIETLKNEGVVDGTKDKYEPDRVVNRAELIKMVVEKTTGIMDNLPATPTFDDVKPGSWFYPYVETGVAQGIVQGYKDAAGNLTGYYGPSDPVTRAAAAKIIAGGLGLPTYEDPAAPFDDVSASAWFAGYIATVYNWSVVDGYKDAAGNLTGKFGPADPVTRAQMAKMLVNAQTPVDRFEQGGTTEPECTTDADCATGETCIANECKTTTGPAKGALEVVLSPLTPESKSIPSTAFNAKYLTVEMTNTSATSAQAGLVAEAGTLAAGGEDLLAMQTTITRRGVGSPNDFDGVNAFVDGRRWGSARTFNQDTNEAPMKFSATPIVIPKGETIIVDYAADISNQNIASGSESYFGIMSADAISVIGASTGGVASVIGDFPIIGNTMRIIDVQGGIINVTNGTTPPNSAAIGENDVNTGQARFEEVSGQEDVCIDTMLWENNGTVNPTDVSNINIFDNSTGEKLVGPVSIGQDDRVFFDLRNLPDGCFFIQQGHTRRVDFRLDINDGQEGDIIAWGLDEPSDIVAHGFIYDAGVRVTDNTGGDLGEVTVKAGEITFDFESPNYRVPLNKNDVNLAVLNVNNRAEPLLVKNLSLTMHRSRNVAGSVTFVGNEHFNSFELVAIDGTVVAHGQLVAAAQDLKVVTGPTDPSNESDAANASGGTGAATIRFTDDWEIPKVGKFQYYLRGDSEIGLLDGEKYRFFFNPSLATDLEVEGLITGDTVQDLQNAQINTGDISVQQETLNLILANTPVSDNVVRGNLANILCVVARAGNAGAVKITQLKFAESTNNPAPKAVATDFINFELRDATGKIIDNDSITGAETGPTFDGLDMILDPGASKTLCVYALISTSATAGKNIAQQLVATPANVAVENDEGDPLVGVQILANGVAGGALNNNNPPQVVFTVVQAGQLEVRESSNNPDGQQAQLGTNDLLALAMEMQATDEDVEIQTVELSADTAAGAQQIKEIKLFADNQQVATATFNNQVAAETQFGGPQPLGTENVASFNFPQGQGPKIKSDAKVQLSAKVSLNPGKGGQATSGEVSRVYLRRLEARGSKEDVLPQFPVLSAVAPTLLNVQVDSTTDTNLLYPCGVLPAGQRFNVGDILYLNDNVPAGRANEQVLVTGWTAPAACAGGTGNIQVVRGMNRTTPIGAYVCTAGTCTTHERIISNRILGLNTLLKITLHPSTVQGNVPQPLDTHDLLAFTAAAAQNTNDDSQIKARIQQFRVTVTGSAKLSDPLLRNLSDQRAIAGVVISGGSHVGKGATEIIFDLRGVTNTRDTDMDDGSSISYSVRGKVSSAGADGNTTRSISLSIADLGDQDTVSMFDSVNEGDFQWLDVNTSNNAKCVRDTLGGTDGTLGQVVDGWVNQSTDNVTPAGVVYLNASDTGYTENGPRLISAVYYASTGQITLTFDQNVFSDNNGATIDALAAADFTVAGGGTLVIGAIDATATNNNKVVFNVTTAPTLATETVTPLAAGVFGAIHDTNGIVGDEANSGNAAQAVAATVIIR